MTDEYESMDMFVYGTLRPGGGLFGVFEDQVINGWDGCSAPGRLYFVNSYFGYPVADFDQGGTITGTVLQVTLEGLRRARTIELGAGYQERSVLAQTPVGPRPCVTYHWPRSERGLLIPSGDWFTVVERYPYGAGLDLI